jgi:hypothetical protein
MRRTIAAIIIAGLATGPAFAQQVWHMEPDAFGDGYTITPQDTRPPMAGITPFPDATPDAMYAKCLTNIRAPSNHLPPEPEGWAISHGACLAHFVRHEGWLSNLAINECTRFIMQEANASDAIARPYCNKLLAAALPAWDEVNAPKTHQATPQTSDYMAPHANTRPPTAKPQFVCSAYKECLNKILKAH